LTQQWITLNYIGLHWIIIIYNNGEYWNAADEWALWLIVSLWAPCVYLNNTSNLFSQSRVANDRMSDAVDQWEGDKSNKTKRCNTKTKTRRLTVSLVQHLVGPPTSVNHSIRVDRMVSAASSNDMDRQYD